MLSTVNTRTVIRMLGVDDLSLKALESPSKRRNRNFRRRENRARRLRHLSNYVQNPRFNRVPTCIEAVSREHILLCNKENGSFDKNRPHILPLTFKTIDLKKDILQNSTLQVLCKNSFNETAVSCELSDSESNFIQRLLSREMAYHPNNAFLNYVNPNVEDKVNAVLRNDAVFNLRFLHNGFFSLSPDTFSKAVNLLDRFIVRVKVKPKYISCVTTACYYIAAKQNENRNDVPTAESLVQITRCGGTGADLRKMEEIVRGKLSGDTNGITALDFIRVLFDAAESPVIPAGVTSRLEVALCSVEIYRYRPACLAIASLLLEKAALQSRFSVKKLEAMAKLCGVEWRDVQACAGLVQDLYDAFYCQMLPSSRGKLVWTLSRRTMLNMVSSSPPPLDTISEDSDNCEETDLSFDYPWEMHSSSLEEL